VAIVTLLFCCRLDTVDTAQDNFLLGEGGGGIQPNVVAKLVCLTFSQIRKGINRQSYNIFRPQVFPLNDPDLLSHMFLKSFLCILDENSKILATGLDNINE
jgi:hypothetical protein